MIEYEDSEALEDNIFQYLLCFTILFFLIYIIYSIKFKNAFELMSNVIFKHYKLKK